jgi:pimeloyl-ACP methyl ester carboxylesterase
VRRRLRALAVLLTALLAAACGSAGATSSASPAPRDLDGCLRAGRNVRFVEMRSPAGPFTAAVLGTGPTAAVLSNESDLDLCAWLPFARLLVRKGIRVLVYDYAYSSQRDALAVAREAHRLGARRIALVGASIGARGSLAAAAAAPPGLIDAVVSLSAERVTREGVPDLFPVVRRVRIPTLYVAARDDPYAAGDDAPQLFRLTAAAEKRLVIVPGTRHGVHLLEGRPGGRVRRLVIAFIR